MIFSIYLIFSLVLGQSALPVLAYTGEDITVLEIPTEISLEDLLEDVELTLLEVSPVTEEVEILPVDLPIDLEPEQPAVEKVVEVIPEKIKKEKREYVDGEILVKYKESIINLNTTTGIASAVSFTVTNSLETKEDLKGENLAVLEITDGKTIEEKIAELKNDPNVEYVQPNFQYYPAEILTDDTYKDELWALHNTGQEVNTSPGTLDADIDAPEAWAINEGDNAEIIVAVIDSGVAYNHPDLIGNMWDGTNCLDDLGVFLGGCSYGYDYQDNDLMPFPVYYSPYINPSHGTHIAGTIAATKNNTTGVIGVAPSAKIMALKTSLSTFDNVKSINFAKANGAKIINASWGSLGTAGGAYDQALYDAIALFPGLFVAASGNHGYDLDVDETGVAPIDMHKFYPSGFGVDTGAGPALNNIIAVTGTDQNDELASFSNYGALSVDIGAPGTNIYSTICTSGTIVAQSCDYSYDYYAGTSMAAPHVAGLVALLWGYQPGLTLDEVKDAILSTGDTLPSMLGKTLTEKRMNAFNALNKFVVIPPLPDIIAPVITLNGNSSIVLTVGDTFTDPGATALDDVDGVVVVVVSGVVDTSTLGSYVITYTATDSANNVSTATRNVEVRPVPSPTSSGGGGGGGGSIRRVVPLATQATDSGCVLGNIFSPITGARCSVSTVAMPGCVLGVLFSSITGERCVGASLATTGTSGSVLGASTFNFTLNLRVGSRGAEVTELQKFLNDSGYNCGVPDGGFGQKTKDCVMRFQAVSKLFPDGIIGPMARSVLNK